MIQLFTTFLYEPLLNALVMLYSYIPGNDLGIAIIVLTTIVRLALSPLVARQYRSQQAMNDLQPKIQEIRKTVKDQKEQSKQLLELYKKEGVHPAGGCLPLIVQLPVLIALFRVFHSGLEPDALDSLYTFIPRPEEINSVAFGFLNLSVPNVPLALAVGISQFIQSKLLISKKPDSENKNKQAGGMGDFTGMMQTQMLYGMPVITTVIALRFPAGLALYWMTTTVIGIVQQFMIRKRYGTQPAQQTTS